MILFYLFYSDEAMALFSKSLVNVRYLKLGGCFLVSDEGMCTYLNTIEAQLEELVLIEGQKLTIESFKPLFKFNCLKKLVLKRCPNVCGEVLNGIRGFHGLRVLKLVDVGGNGKNGVVSDDSVYVELFKGIGSHLSVLSLSGFFLF